MATICATSSATSSASSAPASAPGSQRHSVHVKPCCARTRGEHGTALPTLDVPRHQSIALQPASPHCSLQLQEGVSAQRSPRPIGDTGRRRRRATDTSEKPRRPAGGLRRRSAVRLVRAPTSSAARIRIEARPQRLHPPGASACARLSPPQRPDGAPAAVPDSRPCAASSVCCQGHR